MKKKVYPKKATIKVLKDSITAVIEELFPYGIECENETLEIVLRIKAPKPKLKQ